ncbi:hypothetical protein Tco_0749663 [Tanacetum coccineum]|uniref:Uncharacterized protein n=1 Tax=Tanacetum coccineum TaxID=301880 RepID=A0ABQ4Z1S9_9ASTR
MNSSDPSPSCRPTKVKVPKELPKVSMVNTSLKKLKHNLAGFDVVVKERTTATTTAIIEGSWGFEHTKACFRDEILPFVKVLKDLFNTFDQYFELNELKAQSQEKDTVIKKLKERIKSLSGNMNEDKKNKGKMIREKSSILENIFDDHLNTPALFLQLVDGPMLKVYQESSASHLSSLKFSYPILRLWI